MQIDPAQTVEKSFLPFSSGCSFSKKKGSFGAVDWGREGLSVGTHSLIFVSPAESSPLFKTRSENSFLWIALLAALSLDWSSGSQEEGLIWEVKLCWLTAWSNMCFLPLTSCMTLAKWLLSITVTFINQYQRVVVKIIWDNIYESLQRLAHNNHW